MVFGHAPDGSHRIRAQDTSRQARDPAGLLTVEFIPDLPAFGESETVVFGGLSWAASPEKSFRSESLKCFMLTGLLRVRPGPIATDGEAPLSSVWAKFEAAFH